MSNPTLTKTVNAGAAVAAYRIVKPGATAGQFIQGAAATDDLIAVSDSMGAAAATDRLEIHLAGLPEVEFGGTVAAGKPLTSDATGRAVLAAPAAGATVRIIGFSLSAAVERDIAPFRLAPGFLSNAA